MQKVEETQPRCIGGIQRLKRAPKRILRSIQRSPIAAYLDLYMLLIKREAFDRRNAGSVGQEYQQQLRDALQQIKQLESSNPELKEMRQTIEAGEKGTPATNKVRQSGGKQKALKIMDVGY